MPVTVVGGVQGQGIRVAVVSSVHRWNDTRVYVKQARSLAQAGYSVLLVAVATGHDVSGADGIRVRPLPRRSRGTRWLNWLSILREVVRYRAHIVHAHDPELFPLLAALRLVGYKTICDVHENVAEQILHKEWIPGPLRRSLSAVARYCQAALPRLADVVILAEDSYLRSFPRADNVRIVRNFPLLPPEHKHDYQTDVLRLVYVGDVRIVRGIETYVRILHRLTELGVPAQLRIIGSFAAEEEETRVAALVRSLDLERRVAWLGRRPPEEIPELLADCDIGLALLYAIGNYRESYPTKMFEYMAAGLPVISSDFALWESVLLSSDCGKVVDPVDVEKAAGAVLEYWRSPDLRKAHGRNGRHAVCERYQWENEWAVLREAYSGLHRSA